MGGTSRAEIDITFPDGSSDTDFLVPFSAFENPAVATSVDRLFFVFSGGAAWNAQVDFIDTSASPPPTSVAAPATLGLFGLALAALGWTRTGNRIQRTATAPPFPYQS